MKTNRMKRVILNVMVGMASLGAAQVAGAMELNVDSFKIDSARQNRIFENSVVIQIEELVAAAKAQCVNTSGLAPQIQSACSTPLLECVVGEDNAFGCVENSSEPGQFLCLSAGEFQTEADMIAECVRKRNIPTFNLPASELKIKGRVDLTGIVHTEPHQVEIDPNVIRDAGRLIKRVPHFIDRDGEQTTQALPPVGTTDQVPGETLDNSDVGEPTTQALPPVGTTDEVPVNIPNALSGGGITCSLNSLREPLSRGALTMNLILGLAPMAWVSWKKKKA